ncbi:MAG: DUF1822 family protein [Nodosilinea sp.]
MTFPTDILTLSIPLTAADRRQAERFAQIQVTPESTQRVYRNTLAIIATAHYLKMMGVDSDIEASYSWNPAIQLVADIADLYLPDFRNRIECRTVKAGDRSCYIPEEVWDNRLGFVVIQLDDAGTNAELLGFVPNVSVEHLPLSYLQPLENLVDALEDAPAPTTILGDWLQGVASELWQSLNTLPQPQLPSLQPSRSGLRGEGLAQSVRQLYADQSGPEADRAAMPAFLNRQSIDATSAIDALVHLVQTTRDEAIRFQAAELLWTVAPDHPAAGAQRILDLGLQIEGHALALLIALLPRIDGPTSVLARVYPLQATYLPPDLRLSGIDSESNTTLFNVQSRRQDNYIQFHFTAEPRDRFSLQVSLGESSLTENCML